MTVVVLAIFGLVMGSFVNVLIYRIPRGQAFMLGRSRCPHCNHTLSWYDLIPLFSFLLLRGRCRNCHKRISFQYSLVELASGLLFVFLWTQPLFLIALELLLVIAVIDFQHLVIPDSLLIVLGIVALWEHHLYSALGAFAFFGVLWLVSRGRWIGFGDVKLAGVLGLLFGFPGTLAVIYLAVILGGLFGLVLLLLRKATMKTALPFGTILSIGAALFVFFREPIYEILSRFYLT